MTRFNDVVVHVVLLLVTVQSATSQVGTLLKSNEERGDTYFYQFSYREAIEEYQMAYTSTKDTTIPIKIANSYRKLNDAERAAQWYEAALNNENNDPETYLHYAEALSSIKRYEEAKKWYTKYSALVSEDNRPSRKVTVIDRLAALETSTADITVELADFNSEASDFSPAFYGENTILFVSSRTQGKPISRLFNWDHSEYLNLFLSTETGVVRPFHETINSKYHEGPIAIYDHGSKMIFTRNNYLSSLGKSKDGISKLKLYHSNKNASGEWTKPREFDYNDSEYSVGHPTVTEDGTLLLFASDMPGGLGGTDLYKCSWNGTGWSAPVNLGEPINTEGNEMFPFITPEHQLFFASNGHGGLGGLDIFGVDLKKSNGVTPTNLGKPLNSSLDDFGLIIRDDQGFFSSNRLKGKNKDDIYAFTAHIPLLRNYTLRGQITDRKTNEPLSGTTVRLKIAGSEHYSEMISDTSGMYQFSVDYGKEFEINTTKDNYRENFSSVKINDKSKLDWVRDIALDVDHQFGLVGLVKDKATQAVLNTVTVVLIDNTRDAEVLNSTTDVTGKFNHDLEDNVLNDRISYQIKLTKEGYLGKTLTYNARLDTPGILEIHHSLDLNLDKIDIGVDIGKLVQVNPIYFDLNKFNIRTDAAKELDKIVKVMRENPTIEIELGSHTDSRGSDAYNLSLSDKRAKSSAKYIISQGVEAVRIKGKGYGEKLLINGCKNGIKCSKEKHQENRRTEFKIVKY